MNPFSKSTDLRQDADKISSSLHSEVSLEVIIDSGKRGGVKDPSFMKKLASLEDVLITKNNNSKVKIGRIYSLANISEKFISPYMARKH